jgi:hypothetical protein
MWNPCGVSASTRRRRTPIITVDATREELERLSTHPDVEYVAPDRPYAASNQLAESINAQLWQNNTTGSGIGAP